MHRRIASACMATLLCAGASAGTADKALAVAQQSGQPDGYVQILPRGGIPAIDDPVYVPAGEARIREDAWVLGVIIDDQARAYSLELLNSHEVVNDTIGETDFAAVW